MKVIVVGSGPIPGPACATTFAQRSVWVVPGASGGEHDPHVEAVAVMARDLRRRGEGAHVQLVVPAHLDAAVLAYLKHRPGALLQRD